MYRCKLFQNTALWLSLSALVYAGSALNGNMAAEIDSPVSFETALRLAIERDPIVKQNEAEADSAEGLIEQAGLRPNPSVGAEIENVLGSGELSGTDRAEVTLGISQLIETAGKRAKRVSLARRERELLDWDREERIAALESSVREAFVGVLLAEEERRLRQEMLELSLRSEEEIVRLVEAARASQVELARARLATNQQRFALQQAERAVQTAKTLLAAQWGMPSAPDFSVRGDLVIEPVTPQLDDLIALLSHSLPIARYNVETRKREAALELERAKAKPDLEVSVGSRYFNEAGGDVAFVAGIEIPLPWFDQNQGNIRSARARLRGIEHEREGMRRDLLGQLVVAHRDLLSAQADVRAIDEELLPAAEQMLIDTEHGYERGQFGFLAVLESRQALFEMRQIHLNALRRYSQAESTIRTLTRPVTLPQ